MLPDAPLAACVQTQGRLTPRFWTLPRLFVPICYAGAMTTGRRVQELAQQTEKSRVAPGVIYGVRVLGRYSPNNHGEDRATKGTEYPPEMMKRSLKMYDGARVCIGHVQEASKRDPNAMVGVLKDCRFDESKPGDECLRADLHYLESHEMGRKLAEDASRKLGVFGLSQDAYVEEEELIGERLVVKSLAKLETVDVVYKAATNRNLLESDRTGKTMKTVKKTTLRKLIEAAVPKFKDFRKNRTLHAYRVLEDDSLDKDMDKEMEAEGEPEEGGEGEPGDALDAGFKTAMVAVLDDDTLDMAGKIDKLKKLLAAKESLCEEEDPGEPTKEAEDEDDDEKKKAKEADEGDDEKAKKKEKKESAKRDPELERLKREKAVRKVCESEGYKPTETEIEDFAGMSDDAVKRIVGKIKATPAAGEGQRHQEQDTGKAKSVSPFAIITGGAANAAPTTDQLSAFNRSYANMD